MKIHEYQAKELFKKYGIPIPDGGVAFNPINSPQNWVLFRWLSRPRSMPADGVRAAGSN